MRAYQELAYQGSIVSHVGKGTKVVENLSEQNQSLRQWVPLFCRTVSFLRSEVFKIPGNFCYAFVGVICLVRSLGVSYNQLYRRYSLCLNHFAFFSATLH
jgi:hypothetical protein